MVSVIQRLESYIEAELGDSELYKELATIAHSKEHRKLLYEFSEDEKRHAEEFQKIYRSMTGRDFNPEISKPDISGDFYDILRDRVLDESGDFRKYGEQYISTFNPRLKRAYYLARTDEAVHAFRLLYMLNTK